MSSKDHVYLWSLLTHTQEEKALHCQGNYPTGAPYLVRWIMCDGMGPRIFSIITKCSRFSWVYRRERASRGQSQPCQAEKSPPCLRRCKPTNAMQFQPDLVVACRPVARDEASLLPGPGSQPQTWSALTAHLFRSLLPRTYAVPTHLHALAHGVPLVQNPHCSHPSPCPCP